MHEIDSTFKMFEVKWISIHDVKLRSLMSALSSNFFLIPAWAWKNPGFKPGSGTRAQSLLDVKQNQMS